MLVRAEDSTYYRLYRGGVPGYDDDPGTVSIRQVFRILLMLMDKRVSMSLSRICNLIHWLNSQVEDGPELFKILDEDAFIRKIGKVDGVRTYEEIPAICFEARVKIEGRIEIRRYIATLSEFEPIRYGEEWVSTQGGANVEQDQSLMQAAHSGGD